jgi:hypothetical protein
MMTSGKFSQTVRPKLFLKNQMLTKLTILVKGDKSMTYEEVASEGELKNDFILMLN